MQTVYLKYQHLLATNASLKSNVSNEKEKVIVNGYRKVNTITKGVQVTNI